MGRERCWKYHKVRHDVQLRSTDDRLCQACFDKNGAELDANRRRVAVCNVSASTLTSRRTNLTPPSTTATQLAAACSPLPSATPMSAVTAVTIAVEHTTSALTPATPTANRTDTLGKLNISSTAADNTVTADLTSLLQAEVQRQRELISKLQQQLCFVLSVLGVTEQEIQPTVNAGSQQSSNNSIGKTSGTKQLTNQLLCTDVVANTQYSHSYQQQKPPQHVTMHFSAINNCRCLYGPI
jgi:hypothetical protein